MKKPIRFPGRQPVAPDQFDPGTYSRRAIELAAGRATALRAKVARLREPRDRPTRAAEVAD